LEAPTTAKCGDLKKVFLISVDMVLKVLERREEEIRVALVKFSARCIQL
jgi:hypothetical protein